MQPTISADPSARFTAGQTNSFADELTPIRKARPTDVRGEQVWVKVDDPVPLDPNELTFLATDTRKPFVAALGGVDASKVGHYVLRWEPTRGETGPWGEKAGPTIGA